MELIDSFDSLFHFNGIIILKGITKPLYAGQQ